VLVERQAEVAALTGIVRGAVAGQGAFALALGTAGIGKTSLLREAARLGEEAGALVPGARGTELEQAFGFGIVRQLFEPVLAAASPRRRTELLSGAAAPAAAVLGPAGSAPAAVGDFAVLHGLYWLTASLCRERPVVMVVDDLHWADRASLRFLAYLMPRLEGTKLAVVAASRPHEPGAEQHLLELLMIDRSCTLLRPAPLTETGSTAVLDSLLDGPPSPGFLAACQAATGGNPLLLRELARVVGEEELAATDENLARVPDLGARAMAIRVGARLARLPASCLRLVRAVAVLGDGVPQHQAAALAEVGPGESVEAAERLRAIDILRVGDTGDTGYTASPDGSGPQLGFVHPLVRAAVYSGMNPAERVAGHAAAARLLAGAGADSEHVAKHLLRTPPDGDAGAIEVLRGAGTDAARRGAPDAALGYLRRCLSEPLAPPLRREVLTEIGPIAAQVDLAAAAGYLREALGSVTDAAQRATIAHQLTRVLFYLGRVEEADRVCTGAMAGLPEEATDLRRRLLAAVVNYAIWDPSYPGRAEVVARARTLPRHDSVGAAMLDSVLAAHECLAGDPAAIAFAERAIGGGDALVELASADAGWLIGACETLLTADRDEAMSALDAGLALAHRRGSTTAVAMMLVFRGLGWLWRGQLAEATADLTQARRNADLVGLATAPFTGAFLPEVLVEQGRLDEAAAVLGAAEPDPLPSAGPWYFLLAAKARLARAQGRYREGLAAARAAGRHFGAFHFGNPAFCGWRSEAALCLHALGNTEEATWQADEDLRLARRWGAPRALGRALRVAGLVRGLPDGLSMLVQAVEVLEKTPARLEHATALVDLGAGLRRAGRRADAKDHLGRGIDLAIRCGAGPLGRRAETELRATGARPRQPFRTGPNSLTPSEHRVVSLAADGLSNRDIAQQLFVTIKTVEVHLSSAYRKLGVKRREQLRAAVDGIP